jgi:hypothetical protein
MLKKMSPEALQAMAKIANKMEADRQEELERQKEWIREVVTKTAEKELADLILPDRSLSAIKHDRR